MTTQPPPVPDAREIGVATEMACGCGNSCTINSSPTGSGRFGLARPVLTLFGLVVGLVLLVVVVGEWLGAFERLTDRVPFWVGLALVLAGGALIFLNVARDALRGKITSHTLMTVGVAAALAVGEWPVAAVVVLFIHVANYAEKFTADKARRAVRELAALAPTTARVHRDGIEVEVPIEQLRLGETVIVRPGEQIPVDGTVTDGTATVDQAAITGESMPVEVGPGSRVFAASFAGLGALRIRVTGTGEQTTFGRVVAMVEQAETHRAPVQRIADKFATYYLPVVIAVAALTWLLSGNALSTAAVLVVACSCSFAMATPVAVLASVGAAAQHGLLIKGGRYLEALAKADVLLIDKTGTLTLGRPQITTILTFDHRSEHEVLRLAASAERYSEHPLAEAVRATATVRGIGLAEPADFRAIPGHGVQASVDGAPVAVGGPRLLGEHAHDPRVRALADAGSTLLAVTVDDSLIGVLGATDTPRPDIPAALAELRGLGFERMEMLTGDHESAAAAVAGPLGIGYRAGLLPEDKIAIVKEYQDRGHRVVMVGDGVNDAPALAQSDVGIAMGAAGSDIAIEAAHIAMMREDWMLVPQAVRIARRTARAIRLNIGFTAGYNALGLSLAATGLLPIMLAAAAQSIPDLGILVNSARLLRQRPPTAPAAAAEPQRV
ncbi:cation-translocating P-type ATPase [Mycolicibacterium sp. 120270]|uniref:heavy metal translocating P-type ATPase n=1 Tax=Mycolicibacterium sp. 120270 TaxID=3090600 RepID=UPI00299ED15A|nr:cation-translocating P-type ATPase [Mycolicibacterium sp. 120270]MDX1886854.1 cation-translocating P-type ATPase [Mycolicibacterium sp. 120270]